NLPIGGYQNTVSFKANAVGPANINAQTTAGTLLTAASQTETINEPLVTQLAITSGTQSITSGGCSGPVTIERRGLNNTALSVSTSTVVTLAAAPSNLTFFLGAGCSNAIGGPPFTATIAAGTSSVTISFSGTIASTPTLTVSSGTLAPD